MSKSKFSASPTGFSMTFENGWSISVHFGKGNYCSNQTKPDDPLGVTCGDAEFQVRDNFGIIKLAEQCWKSTDEVAKAIKLVQGKKPRVAK